jgi:HPt (histidine-containing phosphotransfer) domain-containing protein
LPKPVPLDKLITLIAKHSTVMPIVASAITAPDDMPLLTLQTLSDMGQGTRRSREFARLLFTDIKEEMQHLMVSLQTQERQAIEQAAHTLKGLCSHLRDPQAKDLAMSLQDGAKSAALPELQASADLLQGAIETIIARSRKMEEI